LFFKGEVWRVFGGLIVDNLREILFVIGLGLTSVGVARIYAPLGVIVPGVILMWLAIPPRPSRRTE